MPSDTQDESGDEYRERRVTLNRGFTAITAVTTADGHVRVTKQKRRHRFGTGYERVGPKRTIYEGHVMDAALVADVLTEVFESDE
jgi:hypothetical protein